MNKLYSIIPNDIIEKKHFLIRLNLYLLLKKKK